ncbi:crossover junction endodeoxyribonuclease RuvC [Spirochaetia bacterium]|nr:crossover junction endodeoxyribonuclease RuvC [Spirochaetia bacterium]GHU31837.1 crossover junction endodeoxyribonuclease RuvC [Spirochaetia bacterium]
MPARDASSYRIIGVDPGLAATGWGVIEVQGQQIRCVSYNCVETKADVPRAERLFSIYKAFWSVLQEYQPAESAIETLYFAKNVSSAIPVAEARGVLCMTLAQYGIPVREFSPNAIKQAVVGRGMAGKSQVQELVRILLGLNSIPKPDHAADALGVAVCCAHTPVF